MTTYKVYWVSADGFKGYTYIEAQTPKLAREKYRELGYGADVIRIVKDC